MPTMIAFSSRSALIKGIIAVVIIAVATISLEVRPFTDVGERFIGHADNADIAMVARNISEGNGAYTDCVWLLHGGGPPGPEVKHLEGYWSIYLAAYFALFFKIFGANLGSPFSFQTALKQIPHSDETHLELLFVHCVKILQPGSYSLTIAM